MLLYLNKLKKTGRRIKIALSVLVVCCLCLCMLPGEVKADAFSRAYDFYITYGNEMVFQPGDAKTGIIYYGTKAKKATSARTKYETVGWKVTVKDGLGTIAEELYFSLSGNYIQKLHEEEVDGYIYTLFTCDLSSLLSAMSEETRDILETANCEIVFDACMVVKLNEVLQGGMQDGGATWGTVYTTYDGIVNAKNWSASSKETLKTYYGKMVSGLFCEVELVAGTGIERLIGAGRYCYGTTVTISAEVKEGYSFGGWWGYRSVSKQTYSFVINETEVTFHAVGNPKVVQATFHRNWDKTDTTTVQRTYGSYAIGISTMPTVEWTRSGYTQGGWSTNQTAVEPEYIINEPITGEWINLYTPNEDFYMIWDPNYYTICYNSNGGIGSMYNPSYSYTRTFTLPSDGFTKAGKTIKGWSLSEGGTTMDFACGESIKMSDLVEQLGLGFQNNATITLYAVWDNVPVIHGEDIYVTLEDAKSGKITEEYLAAQYSATDAEDGKIAYGHNTDNCFYLTNYSPEEFTMFQKEGYVTENLLARDSAGNQVTRSVKIYIVDSQVYDEEEIFGKVRFISEKYFKNSAGAWITEDAGGLREDSLWRVNEEYRTLLERIFLG